MANSCVGKSGLSSVKRDMEGEGRSLDINYCLVTYWRGRSASVAASQITTKQRKVTIFTLENRLRLPFPSICARKSYIIYYY